jgi:hypothetical protein
MTLFLKRFVSFLLLCVLVYVVLIGIMVKANIQPPIHHNLPAANITGLMFRDLHLAQKTDLLFVGSSHSYRGFDTRVYDSLGWNSFNMGTSSQTPRHTLALLENWLDSIQPQLLVFEVHPATFSSQMDLVEANLNIMANEKWQPYFMNLLLMNLDLRMLNLAVAARIRNLMDWEEGMPFDTVMGTDRYILKGYVESTKKGYDPQHTYGKGWDIDSQQTKALQEIIRLAKIKGIEVMLMQLPVTGSLYATYNNPAGFDSLMNSLAPYQNLNGRMELVDTIHFYDSNHLNPAGAAIVNAAVAEIIGTRAKWKKDYKKGLRASALVGHVPALLSSNGSGQK